ncbi:uncharacterized protein LOC143362883 [Halictus rubicundus]|uniref:uncharacterized protein LOC143362883 n=1 Tax=Halictus rubicundus TaxID=77578 RepID=UPI0040359BCD
MADDPNRDILPVKEGSCADTSRTSIDPRERHSVYKLDRYELEDKYLRMLDEVNSLKKLSNCQEDKIKRLATKLMRVVANPRPPTVSPNVYDDKSRLISLELENTKLKDKIAVLRNQLLSHTIHGRTSSRTRNPQTRPSSARTSSQSDTSRTKIPSCHCVVRAVNDDDVNESRNKIEELEIQKNEMANRIAEMEKELSNREVTNQREKVAENVEYIRRWRQMKQMNDKLIAVENTNESLNGKTNDLRRMLQEEKKNNEEAASALMEERKRSSELDKEILKLKNCELTLREKEEEIRHLMNEKKILQQHNNELIALSSKNGDVELENVELKKKISEQRQDQESLRTAYNSEQANIMALQASNEQLFSKLQELQTTIDSLTAQLTSFKNQAEKQETTKAMQIPAERTDKMMTNREPQDMSASEILWCNKCCGLTKDVTHYGEKIYAAAKISVFQPVHKQVQTEYIQIVIPDKKDQGTSVMTPVKEKIGEEERTSGIETSERVAVPDRPLTPQKMLKLLDQAQMPSNVKYKDMLDRNQRHRQVVSLEKLLFGDTSSMQKHAFKEFQLSNPNPTTRISMRVPPKLSLSAKVLDEATNLYRPTIRDDQLDGNNNIDVTGTRVLKRGPSRGPQAMTHPFGMDSINGKSRRAGCSSKKYCSNVSGRLRQGKSKRKGFFPCTKSSIEIAKHMENGDCTCNSALGCNIHSDCDRRCCNGGPVKTPREDTANNHNQYDLPPIATKNGTESVPTVQSNGQTGVDATHTIRKLQDEVRKGSYRSRDTSIRDLGMKNEELDDAATLQEYIIELDRCKQLVDKNTSISGPCRNPVKAIAKVLDPLRRSEISTAESQCSTNCPRECADSASSLSDTFPMVIPDGQGLMELHISSLQLLTSAKQILFRETDTHNVSVFVCWDILDQETVCTPTLKCPELNFNFSIVYRIPDLFCFFNYVFSELVVFQVNVHCDDGVSCSVASGKLSIKDILDYPQNKLHYVAPMYSVIPCSLGSNFGQLSLWVRLSCDVEQVEAFKRKHNIPMQPDPGTGDPTWSPQIPLSASSYPKTIADMTSSNRRSQEGFTYDETRKALCPDSSFMSTSKTATITSLLYSRHEKRKSAQIRINSNLLVKKLVQLSKRVGFSLEALSNNPKKNQFGLGAHLATVYIYTLSFLLASTKTSDKLTRPSGFLFIHPVVMSSCMYQLNGNVLFKDGSYHPDQPEMIKSPDVDDQLTLMKESESKFHVTASSIHQLEKTGVSDIKVEMPTDPDDVDFSRDVSKTLSEGQQPAVSQSMKEFNALLTKEASKQTIASKDDSDDSMREVNNVLLERNWQQYRKRSFVTYNKLSNFNIVIRVLRHSRVEGCLSLDCEYTCEFTTRLIAQKFTIASNIICVRNEIAEENAQMYSKENDEDEFLEIEFVERDTIVIEIVNIILFPKCSVMTNPDVQLLYVEYCFLGHCGADMETISVKKPTPPDQKLTYNFRKKFQVDSERHLMQDSILRAMLNETANPKIKFIVVCEPIPEETESKECVEVGYAYFNMREYALGKGEKVSSIPIYTPNETEQIGLLKVERTFRLSSTIHFILINCCRS